MSHGGRECASYDSSICLSVITYAPSMIVGLCLVSTGALVQGTETCPQYMDTYYHLETVFQVKIIQSFKR
jgi:hypothetical protein